MALTDRLLADGLRQVAAHRPDDVGRRILVDEAAPQQVVDQGPLKVRATTVPLAAAWARAGPAAGPTRAGSTACAAQGRRLD